MKEACVEKICNLPLDFKTSNKSGITLLRESEYPIFYKEISVSDVHQYLETKPDLIEVWQQWSYDKRTGSGFFLKGRHMGSLDNPTFERNFPSKIESCSEFILRKVSDILDIKIGL